MTITPRILSHSYNPELLNSMEGAFKAMWDTLYPHVQGDNALELQVRLSRTIVSLASDGLTDPAELRLKALETMALNPR